MAKLFGANYEKEGPGVRKNERKKKGFFNFFEIYLRNFWNLFVISGVYSLLSVVGLFVTNGFAKAGITHVARSMGREKHTFLMSDFFDTIKKNWKQSLILGIINVVVTALLVVDIWFFWNTLMAAKEMGMFEVVGLGISLFLLIIVVFIKYYIWTLTITFDLPIKILIKNSFHFCFLNLARNVLVAVSMGLIYAVVGLLLLGNAYLFVLACAIIIFIVPGFKASLIQANIFPAIKKYMIDPYYKEHKGEDIEKRRALGLEISEDELDKDEEVTESIFTDTHLVDEENNN